MAAVPSAQELPGRLDLLLRGAGHAVANVEGIAPVQIQPRHLDAQRVQRKGGLASSETQPEGSDVKCRHANDKARESGTAFREDLRNQVNNGPSAPANRTKLGAENNAVLDVNRRIGR